MANTGMIVGVLCAIVLFLMFVFCFCACCVIRCYRPQRSPGPAWWPNILGQRRIVNKWNDKKGLSSKILDVAPQDSDRYHASFGNISGFGYDYDDYTHSDKSVNAVTPQ